MLSYHLEIRFIFLKENIPYLGQIKFAYPHIAIDHEETILALVGSDDIVWIDGYHFTEIYKQKLQKKAYKLIETNDIPYCPQHVDVLFNHTPGLTAKDFGKTSTQLFLGLPYALLRASFLEDENLKSNNNSGIGEGVLICFGGADTYNLGYLFIKNLLENGFDAPIHWISNQPAESLSKHPQVQVWQHLSETEMKEFMLKSKVLLIPSSVLSMEAVALRKPFFTGYFVDNQKYNFAGLQKLKLAQGFGELKSAADVSLATVQFMHFYENTALQKTIIEQQKVHLDKHSSKRIADIVTTL